MKKGSNHAKVPQNVRSKVFLFFLFFLLFNQNTTQVLANLGLNPQLSELHRDTIALRP